MNIVDQVEVVVSSNNSIFSSQFYIDYQDLLAKYNILIEKGIIKKRQSQLCSISDKLQLITLNCNYTKYEKR
jgi:hypothetical protein